MTGPIVGTADGTAALAPRAPESRGHAPPRIHGNRKAALGTVAAVVIVLGLLVGLGYAGLTPWSKELPGFGSHDSSATGPVTFFTARSAATQAAVAYSSDGWTPVLAAGFVPPNAFFFPGPGTPPVAVPVYNGNASGTGNSSGIGPTPYPPPFPCWWQAVGSANLTGFTVPAAPSDVGTGLAPGWLFLFTAPTGDALAVTVLNGVATPYVTLSGNCTAESFGFGELQSIASGVIDSSQASAVANSWGGAAFLANSTSVNETMIVRGAMTIPMFPCGPCTTGPPPPGPNGSVRSAVIGPSNYTIPAAWSLSYLAGSYSSNSMPFGEFEANLFASNGTVQSVNAWMGPSGYPCYGGVPCIVSPGGVSMGGNGGVSPPPPMPMAPLMRQ
jgi:hypothetical protein